MQIQVGSLLVALAWKTKEHWAIERQLRKNYEARQKYGLIEQDHQRRLGEVFYDNLTQEEFDALPLTSKRIEGPAQSYRGGKYKNFPLLGKKFCIYVRTTELHALGIKYKF